jgi:hypothetical protein
MECAIDSLPPERNVVWSQPTVWREIQHLGYFWVADEIEAAGIHNSLSPESFDLYGDEDAISTISFMDWAKTKPSSTIRKRPTIIKA